MKHIHILSPAKSISPDIIDSALAFLVSEGFKVTIGEHAKGSFHYFSADVESRKSDFQRALDDPAIDVILCSRGGYGCVQFIDQLDWSGFIKHPKYIAGYSDVTVFHNRMAKMGYPSIHGTAPLNFHENTAAALSSLVDALNARSIHHKWTPNELNKEGVVTAPVVGGNLAIIATLIGTNDELDLSGKILFIEEIGEAVYAVDRMIWQLKKSGQFEKLTGLIVGGMTAMKDSEIPFGKSVHQVIADHTNTLNIPLAFDFPAGHIDDNRALFLGKEVTLNVSSDRVIFRQN